MKGGACFPLWAGRRLRAVTSPWGAEPVSPLVWAGRRLRAVMSPGSVTGRLFGGGVCGGGVCGGSSGAEGRPCPPPPAAQPPAWTPGPERGPDAPAGRQAGLCGPGPRVAGVSRLCRLPSGVYPSGSGVTAVEAPLRPEHRPVCFGGRCLGVSFRRRGRRLLQKVFLNRTTRSAGRAAWEAVAAALSAHAQSQPPPGAGTAAGPPAPARRRDAGAAPVPAASRALQPAPLPRGVGARGGALPPAQPARLARAGLCLAI